MFAFLSMNYCDMRLQEAGHEGYIQAGAYPVSQYMGFIWGGLSEASWVVVERATWWFHIVGILMFAVYITYSKHFHIILAFPNTYYSNLMNLGRMTNLEAVTKEVQLMMDPSADPYAAPDPDAPTPERFGAKDVVDLSWKQLLDAYTSVSYTHLTLPTKA